MVFGDLSFISAQITSSDSSPKILASFTEQQSQGQLQYGKDAYAFVSNLGHEDSNMRIMRNKHTQELVAAKWIPQVFGMGITRHTTRQLVSHRRLLHPGIVAFREVWAPIRC